MHGGQAMSENEVPVKKRKLVIKYSCPMCRAVHDKDHVFTPHPLEKKVDEFRGKLGILKNISSPGLNKYLSDIEGLFNMVFGDKE